jgi:hypothetical protein
MSQTPKLYAQPIAIPLKRILKRSASLNNEN